MATISEQLTQLQNDKQVLVDNLVAKGVEATSDETFTTLAPKVANIPSGDISEYFGGNVIHNQNNNIYSYIANYRVPANIEMITKLPPIDCANVKSFYGFIWAFMGEEIEFLNLDRVPITDMQYFINDCFNLKKIKGLEKLNTDNCKSFSYMIKGSRRLPSIDLSNFNFSNATDFSGMFYSCFELSEIKGIENLTQATPTNITDMFYGCHKIVSIPQINAEKVTKCGLFIANYSSGGVNALENFGGLLNLGKAYTRKSENYYSLVIKNCPNLTHDSLMNIINGLYDLNLTYDVANGGTLYRQKLDIGSTNLAKLTEEEIAIATNKGWNVV